MRAPCTRSPSGSRARTSSGRASGSSSATSWCATSGARCASGTRLIRDVAYASLAKSARAGLHERHAAWLDELGGELAEADARIGFHLESACRFAREVGGDAPPALAARAGRRLAAAADAAHGRGDLAGEVGFLDRAVALLGDETPEGAALLPSLISALFESGASDRAEALTDRAVAVSAALGLEGVHARACIEREHIRLSCHPETFSPERSVAAVTEAAGTLRALGDELGLARAAYLRSDLSWLIGDPVGSYAHAEEMLILARRAGSDFDAATALVFMAWVPRRGPVARARGDRALRVAGAGGRGRGRAGRRAQPARVPRRPHGHDRALRRGAGGHEPVRERASPTCGWT